MKTLHASLSAEISAPEQAHMNAVRSVAGECMVLLENDGTLPLGAPCRIALFGNGARETVKGGTGSGDVNSRFVVSIEQGLEEAGFTITTKAWLDAQEQAARREREAFARHLEERAAREHTAVISIMLDEHFLPTALVPVTQAQMEASGTDTAVYVLARNSGEGADRSNIPGDYQLLDEEKRILTLLGQHYRRVLVLLNIGGIIDARAILDIPGINTLLFMGQLGNLTGAVVADVLLGKSIPSGRLTDTWAERYADYPSSATFSHNNGDIHDEYYTDGIYVGYRYFDTFGVEPLYPFGYGLGYTRFDMEPQAVHVEGEEVAVDVRVTNAGSRYAGRETVQVYASAPKGELDKPYQVLVGFGKTRLLQPGETQTLTVRFPIRCLESYSPARAAYLMEAGEYVLRVGRHSRDTHIAAVLTLEETVLTRQVKNLFAPDAPVLEITPEGAVPITYAGETAERAAAPRIALPVLPTEQVVYHPLPDALENTVHDHTITMDDVRAGRYTMEQLVAQLTVEEMADLCVGTERNVSATVLGASGKRVPGAAGDTSVRMAYRGVTDMLNADGPAGLRLTPHFRTDAEGSILPGGAVFGGYMAQLPEKKPGEIDWYQYCTAVPIATMLASSWDLELIERIGDILGAELEQFGVRILLGPGMNLHRNPLCGRNFEYYSEDPLLSGLCAASDVKGIQAHPGIGACPKHFCANNQEDNRMFVNTHIGERALRELYLRSFGIVIEQAQPLTLMTSYNLLNGVHTANSYDLLTCFAREEMGFAGYVMTDWFTSNDVIARSQSKPNPKYGSSSAALCVYAGNDIQMPGGEGNIEDILSAVEDGSLPVACLQQCCCRLLKVCLLCGNPD